MSLFSARNPLKPSFALPGTGQCSRKSSSLRERLALDIGHGTRSLSNLGDVNRSVQKGVGKGRCHYSRVPCRPLLYSTLLLHTTLSYIVIHCRRSRISSRTKAGIGVTLSGLSSVWTQRAGSTRCLSVWRWQWRWDMHCPTKKCVIRIKKRHVMEYRLFSCCFEFRSNKQLDQRPFADCVMLALGWPCQLRGVVDVICKWRVSTWHEDAKLKQ